MLMHWQQHQQDSVSNDISISAQFEGEGKNIDITVLIMFEVLPCLQQCQHYGASVCVMALATVLYLQFRQQCWYKLYNSDSIFSITRLIMGSSKVLAKLLWHQHVTALALWCQPQMWVSNKEYFICVLLCLCCDSYAGNDCDAYADMMSWQRCQQKWHDADASNNNIKHMLATGLWSQCWELCWCWQWCQY